MPPVARRRLIDQIELNDHEKKNLQILDTIRKKGPIARAEISRLIGLNIVTVTSYVDQYIKKGVIKEVGIDVSSGGRKPTLVDLNSQATFMIGVGLNVVDMIAVLCNLKGEVIFSVKKDRVVHWVKHGATPSDTVARLLRRDGVEGMDKFIKRYAKRKPKGEQPAAPTQASAAAESPKQAEAPKEEAPATEPAAADKAA